MDYLDWVDRVLVALDRMVTNNPRAGLVGVGVDSLRAELGVEASDQARMGVVRAVNDLELIGCAEADRLAIKATTQGQRLARAGGLRGGWKSLFDKYVPLDEDRTLLAKVVELSVRADDDFAWTQPVEIKDALAQIGELADQGAAIAVTKRLQAPRLSPSGCADDGGWRHGEMRGAAVLRRHRDRDQAARD